MIRIWVAALLAISACKKPSIEEEAESLRDRMCACTDVACAKAVDEAGLQLGERITSEGKANRRNDRLEAAAAATDGCYKRITGVSLVPAGALPIDAAPSADADAPGVQPPAN